MEADGQEPRAQILEALRRDGGATMDQLAQRLGLSKTATRAHFLRLERDGMIEREAEPKGGGPGRPPARFVLTALGSAVFPTQDADLLALLLGFLQRRGRGAVVEGFFVELWERRKEALVARLPKGGLAGASLEQRLECLKELLEESHFMPRVEAREGEGGEVVVRVQECNCPLPSAVRATRLPCQLEARFLAEIIGGELVGASFAESRAQTCHFEVRCGRPGVGGPSSGER